MSRLTPEQIPPLKSALKIVPCGGCKIGLSVEKEYNGPAICHDCERVRPIKEAMAEIQRLLASIVEKL